MTSRRIPSLRRQALALEPRFLLDAAAVATVADVAHAVAPTDTAPGVEATPNHATVTITDSTDSFPAVGLFSDVDVHTETSGSDQLKSLVVIVDRSGATQALEIDGKTIALEGGGGTTRADSDGYVYSVSVNGSITTVTIELDSYNSDPASVKNLINGMSYQILDKSVGGGTVSVTLKSLTDAGGETADLSAIKATIDIDSRINVAPALTGELWKEAEHFDTGSLGNTNEAAYSSDGQHVYAAGSNNTISVFAVDAASGLLTKTLDLAVTDLGTVNHLVVSGDGKSVYTISSNGNLLQFNVDASGNLTHAATLSVGTGSTGGMAISDDGTQVYVDASNNFGREAYVYSRDTETGALTQGQRLDAVRNAAIATSGNYVTVIHSGALVNANHTLKIYERGADGTLTLLDSILLDKTGQAAVDYAISMSADGKLLFVGEPGSKNISVYRVGSDNLLTRAGTTASDNIGSLALSADGDLLYAATTSGTINVYAVTADGGLTLVTSVAGKTSGADISLSKDGQSLVVAGDGLSRYTALQSLTLGQDMVLGERVSLSDNNFDRLNNGAGNYNGASFSITASVAGGAFGFFAENGLSLANGELSRDGVRIATYTIDGDTLTVRFVGDATTEVANQALQQISYGNSTVAAGAFITLTLRASDGALDSDSMVITLRANTQPQAGPDTGYVPAPATTETDYSVVLPETLFSDADDDRLVWTVTGLPIGLTFDPETRTLSGSTVAAGTYPISVTVTDAYGASVTRVLDLVVAQIDNRAPTVSAGASDSIGQVVLGAADFTATLRADMFSDADSLYGDTLTWSIVDALPAGLVFDATTRTLTGTPTAVGDYVLTVLVTDKDGLSAEHKMTLRVITAAESANHAPAFDVDGSELTYTSDGRINGYGDYVYSVEVSADGRTVIVLGNGTNNHQVAPAGDSTLSVYSRNPNTGELTLLQRFVQGATDDGDAANGIEIAGLISAASAVYSADGKHVYLVGQKASGGDYFLTGFNVGESGALTPTGQSVELGSVQIKQIAASQDGHLYAIAGNSLYAYGIGADGQLTASGVYNDQPFSTASAIAVDAQGRVIVVGANTLTIYAAAQDGSLTRLIARTGDVGNFARSVAVSGDYIYISTGTTGVLTLSFDPGSNTVSKVSSIGSQLWGLELSADGKTLYAGGLAGALNIYSIGADGAPTLVKTVAQEGSSGSYRAFRFGISPDGTSMYVGGFYNAAGLGHIDIANAIAGAYAEGQTLQPAAGLSFSDADYDALASGTGDYNGASITIVREDGPNAGDRYGFADGNGMTLVGSEVRLDGVKVADFTSAGGLLTIAFTGQVSTATANAVLQHVTYTHDGKDPGAAIRLKIQVQDQFASGVDSIVLALAVAQVNDAPVVVSTPADAIYSPGGAAVGLFDGTTISTVEDGQSIVSLTLVASPVADGASESLTVDGVAIPLVAGQGVTASGHAYTVTIQDGTATVVFTPAAGMSGNDTAALIDGLAYANNSAAPTLGERSIMLTAVRDNGGTDNGGNDTAALNLSAKVNVQFVAPSLSTPIDSLDLAELVTLMEDDGYTSKLQGILDVAEVDGKIYVLRTASMWDFSTFNEVEVNTLYVLQRGEDGAISVLQTIGNANVGALAGASELRVSADGNSFYVVGNQGVALFSRDASTGELTPAGTFGADLVAEYGLIRDVLASNDHVYVTAGDNLLVFTQEGSALTLAQTISDAGDSGMQLDGANALTLSADGRFLFVGTSGGGSLATVFSLDVNGAPSFVMAAQGTAPASSEQYYYTTSLTVSPDGKTLYVAEFDNGAYRLHTLAVGADGQLSALDVIQPEGDVKQVVVSPDGSAVFVISGDSIGVYRRGADGVLALASQINAYDDSPDNRLDFNAIRSATLSADGTKLYLTGSFSFNEGLLILDLKPASVQYTEGADAVAVLPSGTLADPQLDALNGGLGNYAGASVTVSRADGAHGDDQFSFIDGDNLQWDATNGVILLNGAAIATFTQAEGALTLRFTATVSQADAQNMLRRIAYVNSSSDPTRDGNAMTLRVVLNDGDGNSDELLVGINLEGVNNPPVVETTPLDPTFAAEGEAVKLFGNTTVDTVESGQNIARVIVTLSPSDPQDILGADGGKILLNQETSGVQRTATGLEYSVRIAGGVTTVTIYLNTPVERAAEIINSLTFNHAGSATEGTRTISLTVQELADQNISTDVDKVATVTLAAAASQNTRPTLEGGGTVPYTERADAVLIAPNVVIADAQMDAFNGGAGNYAGSVLTITLGDGKSASDALAFVAGNGLTLENGSLKKAGVTIGAVSQSNGVLTIRFSDDAGVAPTTIDVQNTLRQITYANSSHAPADSVAVSMALADQRGLPSTALAFAIDITGINDAPQVNVDPVLSLGDLTHVQELATISGLGTPLSSVVSADGARVYLADGNGAIAIFSRDATSGELSYTGTFAGAESLNGISELVLSADGKSLYALRADANAIGVFNVAADGALTHVATLASDYAVDGGALNDMRGITVSDDGKFVYAINAYTVVTFTRNAETGALAYAGSLPGDMNSAPYLWAPTDVVSRGDLVFVVTNAANGSTLIVYRRDDAGALTALAHLHAGDLDATGQTVSFANLQHIAVSADGSTIFVSNSRTSSFNGWTGEYEVQENPQSIDAFRLDAATGALTHLGTLTGDKVVEGIALSADGKSLFVTLSDGTLNYYATANLTLISSQTGLDGARQVVVSADGGVIVVGNSVDVLNAPPAKAPIYVIGDAPVLLAPTLSISDVERDASANYQGANLGFSGQAGDVFGVQAGDGYSMNGDVVLFNGQPIATLTQADGVATLRFTAAVSGADANALLHRVTFAVAGDEPGARSIAITLNDGEISSAARTVDITVAFANRAPEEGSAPYTPGEALADRPYSVVLPESLFTDPDGDVLTWSVSGLPAGLTFDPDTRALSGTVAAVGQYTIVVTVTDTQGASASRDLTLNVAEPPNTAPADSGMPLSPDAARVGEAYGYTLPVGLFTDADGDALTWQISGLPDGLSFDADTLTISGTANTAGSVALTVTATDPSGASVSRIFTLTVMAASTNPDPGTEPGTEPGTNPGTDPGTVPGTDPGTVPGTDPGADPDPNANPNPGTPADVPPPDLSAYQRPAFFADDAQSDADEDGRLQALQQTFGRPSESFTDGIAGLPLDALPPREPWTSSGMLDTLLADALERRDADSAHPFALDASHGVRTPLLVLASPDAPGLSATVAALSGAWRYDAAGNRQVYTLPPGLIRSSNAIASLDLRMADGSALPQGLRLDAARGRIVSAGFAGSGALSLELVVRTVNGETKVIPVTVSPERQGAWQSYGVAVSARDDASLADHKPALSQQLRQSAVQDVLADARQFLASLDGDAADHAPAREASNTAATVRPVNPIQVAS